MNATIDLCTFSRAHLVRVSLYADNASQCPRHLQSPASPPTALERPTPASRSGSAPPPSRNTARLDTEVEWPDADEDPPPGLHWKTVVLATWAAGRPFVWLDDEITDADRRWVQAHHPRKALLHRVDPFIGLTDADFALIRQWLATR